MNDACEMPPPEPRGWSWIAAPALAGLFPVLSLYVHNSHEARFSDAIGCAAVVTLLAVGLAWVLRFIMPSDKRASLGAVWILGWSFLFSEYLEVARNLIGNISVNGSKGPVLGILWAVILLVPLALLKWLRWGEKLVDRGYQIISLAIVAMVGLIGLQAAMEMAGNGANPPVESTAVSDQVELTSLLDGESFAGPLAQPEPARDIYFLVFDRYANADVLQRVFGYDNSTFYDELEKRGFLVERDCLTCYPMTLLSMASTLNLRYLDPTFIGRPEYAPLLEDHAVGRLLIDAGYDYHHFGNSYGPLRKNKSAQENMKVSFLPSEFADSLLKMTPLGVTLGSSFKHRFVTQTFDALGDLADDEQLTFAYAHFLLPHYPYVFARDGSLTWARAPHADKQAYVDQLVAANQLTLESIDRILRESKQKPIIILLADEGPYLMPVDQELPLGEQMEMRCGILSAALIPDEAIAEKWPTPLAPVNIFRFLFREYFAAPLELLPGRIYYWEDPFPIGIPRPGSPILDVTDQLRPAG